MNHQEQQRFEMLKHGPCVPADYIQDFYGLSWPLLGDVRPVYESWAGSLKKSLGCIDGLVSRYEVESFLQQKKLVPKKWMAARLGMNVASLDIFLGHLVDVGMSPQRYVVYPDLIAESFPEDLIPNFPRLKFRSFSDHNSFCARLHSELKQVLGIDVEPLFCATSDRVQEYPRQFALDFDCITLFPLSVKHEMWLDFRKPLNLGPDCCSKLFYAENKDVLRPYCAGTAEPDDLEQYLGSAQHA